MPYRELTRAVDRGPAGAHIGAFFDLDRTLLAGFSVEAFIRDDLLQGRMTPRDLALMLLATARFRIGQLGFSGFMVSSLERMVGALESELEHAGERVFLERLAGDVYPESRALVAAHLRKGHTVAVVSSATRYQIEPLARDLGIPHVLCTRLDVKDGRLTGAIVQPACYGEGKAVAARHFAAAQHVDLEQSHFYTDSHEDLPLLDAVGFPHPTNPDHRLSAIAVARGWPVARFRSRGTPGLLEVLRTSLAVGSLVPSFLLGVPGALLNWRWQQAIDTAITTWGEVGTALAGIRLQVSGEQHLWSHRPAVFIFNHQSGVDMLLICRLLRHDIIGVAKKEVRNNPFFGPFFRLAGTVFVDRYNHQQALAAMAPAVDALRRGQSLVIAPEGTRSVTPRLGRFKKGAFHMAMTAGVPIVPIVFLNALDALPKHAMVVRPTTVEVVVHPPIPTDGWRPGHLEGEIAAIRDLYTRTLSG